MSVARTLPTLAGLLVAVGLVSYAAAAPKLPPVVRTLADFRARGEWKNVSTDAGGRVSAYADGGVELWVEVASVSAAFKYFAEPHAALLVTDARGNVLGKAAVITGLTMAMGFTPDRRAYSKKERVEPRLFGKAAYAFFRLKFCGWKQNLERTVEASNGCAQSSLGRELQDLVRILPDRLGSAPREAGTRFELDGWQAVRLP